MALINNYYVFVTEEKVTRGVDVTSHPVENGLDVTDNVKRKPITLSVTGKIVQVGTTRAATILSALSSLHQSGKYVRYQGRNIFTNAIITSFNTSHNAETNGGCDFDMEIKEIRTANSAYRSSITTATTTKQITSTKTKSTSKYHTVKSGDCLWNIAKKYYGDGTKYKKIYDANKTMLDKKNKGKNVDKYTIYVGQKIIIP